MKGKKTTFRVKISNTGNATASGVKVKVSGKGASGKATTGSIPAGAKRTVKVKVRMKRPGPIKLAFKVNSKNAGSHTVRKTVSVRR